MVAVIIIPRIAFFVIGGKIHDVIPSGIDVLPVSDAVSGKGGILAPHHNGFLRIVGLYHISQLPGFRLDHSAVIR